MMICASRFVVAFSILVLTATPAVSQELTRYRGYALESNMASALKIGGSRESDVKTLHERPLRIQELEWRAPYLRSDSASSDPVRSVLLGFVDDRLYRIAVNYSPERMEGLTTTDIIGSISATYGAPAVLNPKDRNLAVARLPADARPIAQWEDAGSVMFLSRTSSYQSQFQLVLLSKALGASAQTAISESARLERQEAPQRAIDQRKKDEADAMDASEKTRTANKAGFKP